MMENQMEKTHRIICTLCWKKAFQIHPCKYCHAAKPQCMFCILRCCFASEDIVCAVICNQAGHNAGSARGLNVQGIGKHLT